jgi:hypothetical protein
MSKKRKRSRGTRYGASSDSRARRQARFVMLALFLALIIAAAFGGVLYVINVQGRI